MDDPTRQDFTGSRDHRQSRRSGSMKTLSIQGPRPFMEMRRSNSWSTAGATSSADLGGRIGDEPRLPGEDATAQEDRKVSWCERSGKIVTLHLTAAPRELGGEIAAGRDYQGGEDCMCHENTPQRTSPDLAYLGSS
jgi:hypothetical protein